MTEKEYYDQQYTKSNYFGYREWLFAPYVESLTRKCGLKPGSTVLDIGCGQGFFSYLFHKSGMIAHGVDISSSGVEEATRRYGRPGLTFATADVSSASFSGRYDCIFVRSCSLHNTTEFGHGDPITEKLLAHLNPGGTFVFAFNSNFSKKSDTCHYPTLDDVAAHFKDFPGGKILFISRVDTWLLGKHALNSLVTKLNVLISRIFGIGGDVVYILKPVDRGIQS